MCQLFKKSFFAYNLLFYLTFHFDKRIFRTFSLQTTVYKSYAFKRYLFFSTSELFSILFLFSAG